MHSKISVDSEMRMNGKYFSGPARIPTASRNQVLREDGAG